MNICDLKIKVFGIIFFTSLYVMFSAPIIFAADVVDQCTEAREQCLKSAQSGSGLSPANLGCDDIYRSCLTDGCNKMNFPSCAVLYPCIKKCADKREACEQECPSGPDSKGTYCKQDCTNIYNGCTAVCEERAMKPGGEL